MQALKALVVGMGILIVLSMTVIGYGLMKKAEDPNFKFFNSGGEETAAVETASGPTAPSVGPMAPFGEIPLGLPEGCDIERAKLVGGGLMSIEVGPAGACDRVLVVDLPRARVLGTVRAR